MTALTQDREIVVPHETDFQILKRWQIWSDRAFWMLLVSSIIPPLSSLVQIESFAWFVKVSNFLGFILIPIYFALEIVCDRYYISAENTRRKGFIDNSFGSKLTGIESKGYFSNDNLSPNFYKVSVNAFESCLFTERISHEMFKTIGFKNLMFFIIFLCVAYLGSENNPLLTSLLQGLLSGYFLKNCIDFYFFKTKTHEILENFKVFFNGLMYREFGAADVPVALKLLTDYETNLSYGRYKGDSIIYHQLNTQLSADWEQMKIYYNIK